jgi:TatD DNase family protein
MWIDAHAHLYDETKAGLAHVVQAACAAGVGCILNTATSVVTSKTVLHQSAEHSILYAAIGISPFDVTHVEDTWKSALNELCSAPRVIALGETGMDTTNPTYPPEALQRSIFEEQLAIARNHQLPVVVHSRGCEQLSAKICINAGIQAMFHCFTGTTDDLRIILDAGYYVSFSGIATFKQNPLDECIRYTPLDRILMETDSPYLAPVPFRGTKNTPALVPWVGKKIAAITGVSEEAIAEHCAQNFSALFGINLCNNT